MGGYMGRGGGGGAVCGRYQVCSPSKLLFLSGRGRRNGPSEGIDKWLVGMEIATDRQTLHKQAKGSWKHPRTSPGVIRERQNQALKKSGRAGGVGGGKKN